MARRIAFLCAPTLEPWTPRSVDHGIGGSEEAVINMAAKLADLGYAVGVYMEHGVNRRFGDVFYGTFDSLPGDHIDVAVIWRRPIRIRELDRHGIRPGRAYLWLHDNLSAETVTDWRHRYRKIMVLSRYHRARYARLPDEAFFVTANGIDPAQFQPPNPLRDPFQVVYGSDYSRGLRHLLTSWAAIRHAVPTAKLNVFYGWQGIERINPERAQRMHAEFDPLLSQHGITHLGRLSHAAVADQFRRAGIWAYPCSFRETSCITAMKAQAGGAIPAVIPNGALRDTVRFGFRTGRDFDNPGGADGDGLVDEWRQGLIELLQSPERQLSIRRAMVPASREAFDWSHVASAWDHEFSER
jgi:glycosyltransferase involved in cell wall biosynthesis